MFEQNAETQEMVLAGQGEIHLKVAVEKLQSKYGLKLDHPARRACPIAKPSANPPPRAAATSASPAAMASSAMCVLEIRPLPRGAGFVFHDRIKGGVVPKQWIGSVEKGVVDYLKARPAGLSGGRCRGGADRRLLSHGGFLRRRLPDRRAGWR